MIAPPTKLLPGLLIAVALVAGWRTTVSTRQVLGGTKAGEVTPEKQRIIEQETAERRLLTRVATDDSLLGALRKSARVPDPFNPTSGVKPPDTTVKPEPIRLPRPTVVMVIVEPARQEVILRLGSTESPRLRVGNAWKGWSIVRIDRDIVEIENQDEGKAYVPVPNVRR